MSGITSLGRILQNISPGAVETKMIHQGSASIWANWNPDENQFLQAEDIAKACIAVVDTSRNCLVSVFTV